MDLKTVTQTLLEKGWTQGELARAIGVSQGHVSQIAAGKYTKRGPSYKTGTALVQLYIEATMGTNRPDRC